MVGEKKNLNQTEEKTDRKGMELPLKTLFQDKEKASVKQRRGIDTGKSRGIVRLDQRGKRGSGKEKRSNG